MSPTSSIFQHKINILCIAGKEPRKLCLHRQVEKGSTAAVFGLGTIGLAVVDALRDAGAKRIIGVDTDPGKYDRAKMWGATDIINPKDYDKPIQVPPGCCANDCASSPCMLQAYAMIYPLADCLGSFFTCIHTAATTSDVSLLCAVF